MNHRLSHGDITELDSFNPQPCISTLGKFPRGGRSTVIRLQSLASLGSRGSLSWSREGTIELAVVVAGGLMLGSRLLSRGSGAQENFSRRASIVPSYTAPRKEIKRNPKGEVRGEVITDGGKEPRPRPGEESVEEKGWKQLRRME